jgi:ferritin-like metal-binding protein YciE
MISPRLVGVSTQSNRNACGKPLLCILDATLTAAAQKVQHDKFATYETLVRTLGYNEVIKLLLAFYEDL